MSKDSRTLDKAKILQFLEDRREHSNPLIYSVLEGLRTRIERGDFDAGQESEVQLDLPPICARCGKTPEETGDYDYLDDPNNAVKRGEAEGTYNPDSNQYYCDDCYIAVGQPLGIAP